MDVYRNLAGDIMQFGNIVIESDEKDVINPAKKYELPKIHRYMQYEIGGLG